MTTKKRLANAIQHFGQVLCLHVHNNSNILKTCTLKTTSTRAAILHTVYKHTTYQMSFSSSCFICFSFLFFWGEEGKHLFLFICVLTLCFSLQQRQAVLQKMPKKKKRECILFYFLLGGFSRILVSIIIVAEIIGHYGLCLFVLLCAYVRFVCMHVCVRVHAYVRMCG